MNVALRLARRRFKGISWRNPIIHLILHALDPFDNLVRRRGDLSYLPVYSTRVRSNGIQGQFGGRRFAYVGNSIAQLLQEQAQLAPTSQVLEVGCGCGRIALALTRILGDGQYTGVDIDAVSIEACRMNDRLSSKQFRFDLLDVRNLAYNPDGHVVDANYTFSYPTGYFDVIFLISVFTHMLPEGVTNYINEFGRMLKPGGRCFFSTFLMDYGHEGRDISFPYAYDDYRVLQKDLREKAVGYYLSFFDMRFAAQRMKRIREPLIGLWRKTTAVRITQPFDFRQDILIYSKLY